MLCQLFRLVEVLIESHLTFIALQMMYSQCASFRSGMGATMDHDEAGPSGMDNVKVKMEEPEWVDAGALEPNCELAGQYEDNADYNSGYGQDALTAGDGANYHHFITGQPSQPQQPPLVSIVIRI